MPCGNFLGRAGQGKQGGGTEKQKTDFRGFKSLVITRKFNFQTFGSFILIFEESRGSTEGGRPVTQAQCMLEASGPQTPWSWNGGVNKAEQIKLACGGGAGLLPSRVFIDKTT